MNLFEKQQRVESVRGIVRARWIVACIIVGLGFALKTKYTGGWAPGFEYFKIAIFGSLAFAYNFVYWIFIRRPIEKISDRALGVIAVSQIVVDQLMYTLIFYFTGTVESVAFVLYYLTILLASSLYKTRGIILTGLMAAVLHDGLLAIEYYKIIPHVTAYKEAVWFGIPYVTVGKILGFTFYIGAAVVYSVYLSDLIRKRESRLRDKSEKLTEQTQFLTAQTQELTETKNWLHDELDKSDKARAELSKIKDELEKSNLELRAKVEELEKYGEVTTGRELKMTELKERIKVLEEKIQALENNKS